MSILDSLPDISIQQHDAVGGVADKYWQQRQEWKNNPKSLRIDGVQYWLGDDEPFTPKRWKGFGGRKFTIRRLTGEVIETDNLWYNGDIPEAMREQLPDNAEFVRSKN